jgi:hypothetical protein
MSSVETAVGTQEGGAAIYVGYCCWKRDCSLILTKLNNILSHIRCQSQASTALFQPSDPF